MKTGHSNYLEELYELRNSMRLMLNKDFLQALVELARLIDKSQVENHHHISDVSSKGFDCVYARQAQDVFMKLSEAAISDKIEYIYKTFIEQR